MMWKIRSTNKQAYMYWHKNRIQEGKINIRKEKKHKYVQYSLPIT